MKEETIELELPIEDLEKLMIKAKEQNISLDKLIENVIKERLGEI